MVSSTLGDSWKPRCRARCALSALSRAGMYYVDRLGPENASAIRNSEVAAIGKVLLYYVNGDSIGTAVQWPLERGGPYWEVVAYRGSTVVHN